MQLFLGNLITNNKAITNEMYLILIEKDDI